jgi:hypothetical protein
MIWRRSVEADQDLEVAAVGVVAPEGLGDVVGLVVLAGGDAAGDRGVADVDALVGELLVEHPRVGDLAGRRRRRPRPGPGRA